MPAHPPDAGRRSSDQSAKRIPQAGPDSLEQVVEHEKNPVIRFFKILGPGLITGASDDDPSGIGTYLAAGASFGFATLWMALFTLPLQGATQLICARIGMVTGKGIAGIVRQHYPRGLLYPVVFGLVVANLLNAGVDIGAIAASINLLIPIPIPLLVAPIAILILLVQVFGSYRLIASIFKWLTLSLFAYIAASFFAHPALGEVLRGTLIPTIRLDKLFLATLVALLGTTISPYLFFWQAEEEVEEEINMGRKRLWQRVGATNLELKYAALDVYTGMFLSNLVMYFIILTAGSTLFAAGKTHIASAADAAVALRPLAGDASGLLLAVGVIGAGMLAVPILTASAAYSVSEAFNWRRGLDEKPKRARRFYLVIAAITLVGMVVNFLGISPIDALFVAAVVNGLLAPPLLIVIMLISNNDRIMGERVNGRWLNIFGWATTLLMGLAAVALIVTSL